jgi:cysteine synthase
MKLFACCAFAAVVTVYLLRKRTRKKYKKPIELIGETPIIELESFACRFPRVLILAKCEFMNPGGSPKDRVAKAIIDDFEERGLLTPHKGYTVYEGTVGSTGISLAWQCRARGYNCVICMPEDVASEKREIVMRYGATVVLVKPASIVDSDQFVNKARQLADQDPKGVFADQFENTANFEGHFKHIAPEILRQTGGAIDYLVMGCGTGGTLTGSACYLKQRVSNLKVILADPQGSGLYNRVNHGVFYSTEEAEGRRRRHQIDTVIEGVGINRMTKNMAPVLEEKLIDEAIRVSDREAVCMARYLALFEGVFVGSSSCVNLVACVKKARSLGLNNQPAVFLTLLCDSGQRHLTKFWCDDYLVKKGILAEGEAYSEAFLNNLKNLNFLEE